MAPKNNELHQNADQKDHQSDDHIALDYKFTEGFNHFAGIAIVGKDLTGRRYIQSQTKQGGDKQQRRIN